jgi:hypothetical protein
MKSKNPTLNHPKSGTIYIYIYISIYIDRYIDIDIDIDMKKIKEGDTDLKVWQLSWKEGGAEEVNATTNATKKACT